jgi:hypothetical protein
LNIYYHKKKHTKKHWKKKLNGITTCEDTTSVTIVAIITRSLPKHMEKLAMTFTCEGKHVVKHRYSRDKILYYICHFAQNSFTNHNSPFVPHELHISCKQTNKQGHKINVEM